MKTLTVIIVLRIFLRIFLGRLTGKVNQFNEQGQEHGHWVERFVFVEECPYVDGKNTASGGLGEIQTGQGVTT